MCTLAARRTTQQNVHNKIMKVIQDEVEHEKTEERKSIWDSQVKKLFPELKQKGDVAGSYYKIFLLTVGAKAHRWMVMRRVSTSGTNK